MPLPSPCCQCRSPLRVPGHDIQGAASTCQPCSRPGGRRALGLSKRYLVTVQHLRKINGLAPLRKEKPGTRSGWECGEHGGGQVPWAAWRSPCRPGRRLGRAAVNLLSAQPPPHVHVGVSTHTGRSIRAYMRVYMAPPRVYPPA